MLSRSQTKRSEALHCGVGVYTRLLRCLIIGALAALGTIVPLLTQPTTIAQASQFGLPWQGIIVLDDALVYSQPSIESAPVGPLPRGAKLPVLSTVVGGSGPDGSTTWYRTTVGFLPAVTIREHRDPWIAEAKSDNLPVYFKPNAYSGVRRRVHTGDLLQVTGISPGMAGDTGVWWATTEGYLRLEAIREATSEFAASWTMPEADEALDGWWGTVVVSSNVRAAATTDAPVVGFLHPGQRVKVLSEEQGKAVSDNDVWYRIDGGRYAGARVHSSLIWPIAEPTPNTTPPHHMPADRTWITIDRSAATLTLIKDGSAVFTTYVSLGRAGYWTPTGQYSTFGKFRARDMSSDTLPFIDGYHHFPNVPHAQFFRVEGHAIHGTYWHDNFGTPQSLGCVNVTVTDSAYLFNQTRPGVPPTHNQVWSPSAQATPVVIIH